MTLPLRLNELQKRLAQNDRSIVDRARRSHLGMENFHEAAVLVPILVEPNMPLRLIFTVRPPGLRHHAGQISFPGGKREKHDASLVDASLREAHEELGIPPGAAQVLGLLDDEPTPTGFIITPVVAALAGPLVLSPAPEEVASVFMAEVDSLGEAARYHNAGEIAYLGETYQLHEYLWEQQRIWGVTARILHKLLALLV